MIAVLSPSFDTPVEVFPRAVGNFPFANELLRAVILSIEAFVGDLQIFAGFS
jgi:hypothetical protein